MRFLFCFLFVFVFLVTGCDSKAPNIRKQHVLDAVANRTPAFQKFLPADKIPSFAEDLVKEFPDVLQLKNLGTSDQGLPILAIQAGSGREHVLVYTEGSDQVGVMTMMYLAQQFAQDPYLLDALGVTWHLILAADPDAANLTGEWLKQPRKLPAWAKEHWMEPDLMRVDKEFTKGKRAAQKTFSEQLHRQDYKLIVALRDEPFSGMACVVNRLTPELAKKLSAVFRTENFLLASKEYGALLGAEQVAPGVFRWQKVDQEESSALFAEVITPLFFDPSSGSKKLSKTSVQQAAETGYREYLDTRAFVQRQYENFQKYRKSNLTLWDESIRSVLGEMPRQTLHRPDRKATESDEFAMHVQYNLRSLQLLGQLLSLMEQEVELRQRVDPELHSGVELVRNRFETIADELEEELDYAVISIQRACRIQLLSLFSLVDSLP